MHAYADWTSVGQLYQWLGVTVHQLYQWLGVSQLYQWLDGCRPSVSVAGCM